MKKIIVHRLKMAVMIAVVIFAAKQGIPQYVPSGGYQGGGHGSGGDQTLDVVVVDLKVNLQAAWLGGAMQCTLNNLGLLPLSQPFNSPSFYWHYTGDESVVSIPSTSVVDWIEVELRETAGGPSTADIDSVIGRRAGFLLNNGTITDLDGSSKVRFRHVAASANVYAVIEHRNHLGIMNSSALSLTDEVYAYDFTTAQSKAYQDPSITGNAAMADLGGGNFGLWAGNAYPDYSVKYDGTQNDREAILDAVGALTPSNVTQAYNSADVNMDSWLKYMGSGNDKVYIYNVLGGNVAQTLHSHVP
jgi:hypothetical protein